ncbi:MAG: DUF1648 domain-containing protein [Anaerolineae bacterium]|nr:DUF1648 domain-containing protein [Anaerolineae bacterium]
MTEWQTDPQTGLRVGVILIAAILIVAAGLVALAATQPVTIWTFVAGLAALVGLISAALIGYWIGGLIRSGYALDRNALTITWGANELVIPTPQIKQAILGSDLTGRLHFHGVRWPGYWVGDGEVEGLGRVVFYATEPPAQQVFLVTEGLTYAISPEEGESFLRTLQTRLQMGPTQLVESSSKGPAFLQWHFWRDALALALLVGGFVVILGLLGLLTARFPALPRLLPLHFDASGNPDRLGPRGEVFFVPVIGLLVWLANGTLGGLLYRRERLVSYLFWAGALLVQMLLWAAAIGILTSV